VNWTECEHFQEMWDLRHTWSKIQCDPEKIVKPTGLSCDGCPLLNGVTSNELERYVLRYILLLLKRFNVNISYIEEAIEDVETYLKKYLGEE